MANEKTKVLILGGGFGGIKAALELAGDDSFDVTLLSETDSFRYYPTLYQIATGGKISAGRIPLKEIFEGKKIKIIEDTAKILDRDNKQIIGASGKKYAYDELAIALGVVTNYFGIKGLDKYSYGIKSVEDAIKLRDHVHNLLLDEGKPDANYIIIGGGPTGVELAGALPIYIRHVIKSHSLQNKKLNIELVEAMPHLMPRMPKSYSRAAEKRLRKLGVKLVLKQAVQAETADSLVINGKTFDTHTVVWTAGVTNNPFFKNNSFNLNDKGKVSVDEYLQAELGVYVVGDNADTPYSGMAQTALHDAVFLANNLKRIHGGRRPKSYKAKEPSYVTPVGPGWAAVLIKNIQVYGWWGWLIRSAADFIGYHEYQPWWKASKHWLAEYDKERNCPVCYK